MKKTKEISLNDFFELLKKVYAETTGKEIVLATKIQRRFSLSILEEMHEQQTGEIGPVFVFGTYNPLIHNVMEMEKLCFIYGHFIQYLQLPPPLPLMDNEDLAKLLRIYADNIECKTILVETEQLDRNYFLKEEKQ